MAPTNRLEEKLRKLGLSHEESGSSRGSSASKTKHSFRIYFPLPPYDGLQFNALRSGSGFNFTGQLLGIGGKQLQRIKQESSARVEVVNAHGNLNGAHPDPLDPQLHALITADSMGKLQKAADMVWELLQPTNARYHPIHITPGGSARLTVTQAKKGGKCSNLMNPSQAATPTAVGEAPFHHQLLCQLLALQKPRSCQSSQSAAAAATEVPSRSLSVSPAMTPVTPAATAGSAGAFTARNNSCSSNCRHSCTSPPAGQSCMAHANTDSSNISRSSGLSRTNDSIQVVLFNSPDDGFKLPPAAVTSLQPTPAAKHAPTESSPVLDTSEPAETDRTNRLGQSVHVAAGYPAVVSCSKDRAAEHTIGFQQADDAGSTCGLQPPTPSAEQTAAVPAAVVRRPADTAVREEINSDTHTKGPLTALKIEHKQMSWSPVLGPEGSSGSCSSCFQYGLGLCNSSSWDSPLSCDSKESPALRALIVDHQRQQQQQFQQMQMRTGMASHPHTPAGFSNGNRGHSSLASSSYPDDGFNLGPAALLPAGDALPGGDYSNSLPPPMETLMQLSDSRYRQQVPANEHQQWQYHAQRQISAAAAAAGGPAYGGFAAPGSRQSVEQPGLDAVSQAGTCWGVQMPGTGVSCGIGPVSGACCEANLSFAGTNPLSATSAWLPSHQHIQSQQSMLLHKQYPCSWGDTGGVFAFTHKCSSYDQAHALSSSIW